MTYRIIDTDGTLLDRRQWPGRWCLQAVQLEEYCDDHGYELVRTRPNSAFTEITVTVKNNNINF
jgi:hypothetical protein